MFPGRGVSPLLWLLVVLSGSALSYLFVSEPLRVSWLAGVLVRARRTEEGFSIAAGMDALAAPGAGVRVPRTPPRRKPRQRRNPQQSPVRVHVLPAGKRRLQPKPPPHPPPQLSSSQSRANGSGKRPTPPSQPPPAKLIEYWRRRDSRPVPPRGPPPARLLDAAAAARGLPGTGSSVPAAPPAASTTCWPTVWVVGYIHRPMAPPVCVQQPARLPCVQRPPQLQPRQAPRPLQPLLRPKLQGLNPCHVETCVDLVPSAKKSAGAPPFVDFQGSRDYSCKYPGAEPVSHGDVFNRGQIEANAVVAAANGSVDEAVEEAIQGTCSGDRASRRQRRKRKVEGQPKAAATLTSKVKSDVGLKSKAFLGESKRGGEGVWRGDCRGR